MKFDILRVLSFIFVATMNFADSDISSPCSSKDLGLRDASLCSGRIGVRSRESREISMQNRLHRKRDNEGEIVECCPTFEQLTEPEYGRNSQGDKVALYRDENIKQVFVEYPCKSNVIAAACSSFDPSLVKRSKCVQQFLLTYAIVQSNETTTSQNKEDENEARRNDIKPKGFVLSDISEDATRDNQWKLDYITLRSGCNYIHFTGN